MEVHTGWEPDVLELKLKTKRKCHVDIDISDGITHSNNTAISVQQQGGSGRCPGYCQSKHAAQDALSAPSQTQHGKKEAKRQLDAVFKAASTIEEIAPLSGRDAESALHRQLREANKRVAELEKREADLNATVEELKASAAASVAKGEADRAEITSSFTAKLQLNLPSTKCGLLSYRGNMLRRPKFRMISYVTSKQPLLRAKICRNSWTKPTSLSKPRLWNLMRSHSKTSTSNENLVNTKHTS